MTNEDEATTNSDKDRGQVPAAVDHSWSASTPEKDIRALFKMLERSRIGIGNFAICEQVRPRSVVARSGDRRQRFELGYIALAAGAVEQFANDRAVGVFCTDAAWNGVDEFLRDSHGPTAARLEHSRPQMVESAEDAECHMSHARHSRVLPFVSSSIRSASQFPSPLVIPSLLFSLLRNHNQLLSGVQLCHPSRLKTPHPHYPTTLTAAQMKRIGTVLRRTSN